jgi:uncharacterized RDD family membrane protein YckC
VIDRLFDSLLPTRYRPAPSMETVGEANVLLARGAAVLLDLLVCYLLLELPVFYAVSVLFRDAFEARAGSLAIVSLLLLAPLYLTYSFAFEWRFGRTPGKVNRGLLVVTTDGGPPGVRAVAVRNLLRYVDLLGVPPLVLGAVVAFATGGRRVGDHLAGTVVVRATAGEEASHLSAVADVVERRGEAGRIRSQEGDRTVLDADAGDDPVSDGREPNPSDEREPGRAEKDRE